jgi:hypothetical protein
MEGRAVTWFCLAPVVLWCCAPTRASSNNGKSTSSAHDQAITTQLPPDTTRPPLVTSLPKFVCGIDADKITAPVVVVDLRLKSGNGNRVPSDTDVKRIEASGGRVLHRFNVALVRTRLDTNSLRQLVSPSGIAEYATLVDDPQNYEVNLQIFFSRPITSADLETLRRINVKASPIPVRPEIAYARAEDSTILQIEQLPGVDFVRARAIGCGFF